MIEIELFDGTVLEFPEGTDPAVIDRVAKAETQSRRVETAEQPAAPAPSAPPEEPGFWQRAGMLATDVAGSAADGLRQGVASIAGLPVEAINASPLLGNLLPGEQGFQPMSDRPRGGFEDMDALLRLGGAVPDYEPQTTAGRFTNRVGEELGATAVPLVGLGAKASSVGVDGVRQMGPVARSFLEPMAVAPGRVAAREMTYAGAAGTGAQALNEIVTPDGEGTWWSDLLGSVGGMATLGTANAVGGLGRNMVGAATGRTGAFDDVAGRQVVDRLIDNSSDLQQRYAQRGAGAVDASPLASSLSMRSDAERVIPGFQANIADRVQDPGLSTLAYNTDTMTPGAANLRRTGNAAAIDERMAGLAPGENPAALREALSYGAQGRISDATDSLSAARTQFDDAAVEAAPQRGPVDRGYAIRSSLQSRADAEKQTIADMYGQIDGTVPIDATALQQRMDAVSEGLPVNDRLRFRPSEADVPGQLPPEAPVSEAMAMRSGLSSDIRSPSATDQQRRVSGQYLDEVDQFIRDVLPEDQRALMETAKTQRLDVGRRFEDRGAVPDILRETGRGQYTMPNETVPGRVTAGPTDYQAVMREVGTDETARRAVADQIKDEAVQAKALRSPEALARFVEERNFAMRDFPEVRNALERAGASKQTLDQAERAAQQAEKLYSPGGRSAAGQYLKFDDTQTRAAIGTAWKSAQPEKAVRELLDVAGDTPDTRAAARAALWEEVSGTGKLDAPTMTSADGVQRWSGRKLQRLFNDNRFAKTADVLWEDAPEHLSDIRQVVDALSKADGSVNAKAVGASGTAQSLSGKFDPALSTASIASRARSVNRGQLSPTIAIVDILSTALRNRSAKVQGRAIDELMSRAVNDPDLAASLLRKYNPADEAAENRAFLTRFGVRLPTVANIISGDDSDEEDPFAGMGAQE